MTTNSAIFNQRLGHWAGEGLSGRAVYERLAADPELPAFFEADDVAAITGLTPNALKMRRARKMEPPFTRLSRRHVRYPRESFCAWLAQKFHPVAA